VISVALFAALGHVRRTGEDLRGGQIEVRDDEFVVLVNACAGAEFSGEGLRRVGFQVGPADDAFGSVRLLDGEAAFLVRDAITEDALAGEAIDGRADQIADAGLAEECDRKEDRRRCLVDRARERL
jgi:hypothetical protein